MNRRVKRRLWLLGLLVVTCTSTVLVWLLFATWNRQRRIESAMTEGMAAYEQGDYVNALSLLRYAVTHKKDDPGLLLAFADSRLRNVDPRGKRGHVRGAIKHYEAVLNLDPDNQEALKSLFKIYVSANQTLDALMIANRIEELDDE